MILWQKMVMLYLAIAIGCVFWQPAIVFSDYPSALNFFDVNQNNWNTTNNINLNSQASYNINGTIAQSYQQGNTQSGGVVNTAFFLIDALFAVIAFIGLLFAFIFSPFTLMIAGAFPITLIYIIGIPMVVMFLISLIGFIRGTG